MSRSADAAASPVTADDLDQAVQLAVAVLRQAPSTAWEGGKAGSLEWDCWETVEHISDALLSYAATLGPRTPPLDADVPFEGERRSGPPDAPNCLGALVSQHGAGTALPGPRAAGRSSPGQPGWSTETWSVLSEPNGRQSRSGAEYVSHVTPGRRSPWRKPSATRRASSPRLSAGRSCPRRAGGRHPPGPSSRVRCDAACPVRKCGAARVEPGRRSGEDLRRRLGIGLVGKPCPPSERAVGV